jgi:hypothetical protein
MRQNRKTITGNIDGKYAVVALVGVVIVFLLTIPRSLDSSTALSEKVSEITANYKDENTALSKKLDEITNQYHELTKQHNELINRHNELVVAATTSTNAFVPSTADAGKAFLESLIASGSDKYHRHHYENYYMRWFAPFRDVRKLKMLEIGADTGKSLLLWSNFFTDPALILGLAYGIYARDIDENVRVHQEAGALRGSQIVQVIEGDQSEEETMETLRNMGPYQIIIDDGSHIPDHMAFSLFSLWNSVAPGGLYIVEDLECNYWQDGASMYGYTLRGTGFGASPKASVVEKIKQLIDTLVKNQIGATKEELSIMPGDETICSIEFGKNVLVVKKCSDVELANAPPFNGASFDQTQMDAWVQNAKSTNPLGFQYI